MSLNQIVLKSRAKYNLLDKCYDPEIDELTTELVQLPNASELTQEYVDQVIGGAYYSGRFGLVKEEEVKDKNNSDNTIRDKGSVKMLLVTHEDVTKSVDGASYAVYAGYKCISLFDGTTLADWGNYIRKYGAQNLLIQFMKNAAKEFPDGKVPSRSTVMRLTEKLLENNIPLMKIEDYKDRPYFKLRNCIDNHWYVGIEYDKVRELCISCSSNAMKLYAIMCYATNETEYKPVTRTWLAEKMGLSTVSENNLTSIGTMLTSLCNLGFLKRLEETQISKDGNVYKTTYKYRITTYAEYKQAKRRGTSRRIIK